MEVFVFNSQLIYSDSRLDQPYTGRYIIIFPLLFHQYLTGMEDDARNTKFLCQIYVSNHYIIMPNHAQAREHELLKRWISALGSTQMES